MGGMNPNKRGFLQDFFPVNTSAGYLRALLTLLTAFILWTFYAQNQADPASPIFDPPAGAGLIASVLSELAWRYFHPTVLLLTFTPFVLFYFAYRQVAAFLSASLDIHPRQMRHYLMRGAFSMHKIKTRTDDKGRIALDAQADILYKLGGPAQIQIRPEDILLIETISDGSFKMALCRDTTQPCVRDLGHAHKIAGLLHESDLCFTIKTPAISEPITFKLAFSRLLSTEKDGISISPLDACFLLSLLQPKSPIKHFLNAEVRKFFQKHSNAEPENMRDDPIQPSKPLPARKPYHKCYAQYIWKYKRLRKYPIRLHRRSCYSSFFARKTTAISSSAPGDGSQAQLLKELKLHLQREMVSFFNLSTIHITITK